MTRQYIVYFNQGKRGKPLDLTEDGELSAFEKGQARKAYEKGRAVDLSESIQTCLRYMRVADIRALNQRLAVLHMQTLVDMYGEEGATEFLKNTRGNING